MTKRRTRRYARYSRRPALYSERKASVGMRKPIQKITRYKKISRYCDKIIYKALGARGGAICWVVKYKGKKHYFSSIRAAKSYIWNRTPLSRRLKYLRGKK